MSPELMKDHFNFCSQKEVQEERGTLSFGIGMVRHHCHPIRLQYVTSNIS